jgi:putative acetyltransferase
MTPIHPPRRFRWATAEDGDLLADIMFDAVRNGESRYSEAQRAAWVPARRGGPDWAERLRGQDIVVAEQGGEAVGFASLAEGGYVDFAFIRPEARHSGLFRSLLERVAGRAVEKGETRLWTHASLTAEPAFAKLGFAIRKRERVAVGGEALDRCEMEKSLAPG